MDFAGQPCNYDELLALAAKYGLIIIEDACHALGASYRGRKAGSISDMTVFSFHPVKHITTGEGGAILTDNKKFYEKLKHLRHHGIIQKHDKGGWYYEITDLGYNYRITDFQCAIGLEQLKKLDFFIARRRHLAHLYTEALEGAEELTVPHEGGPAEAVYHLYAVQLNLKKVKKTRREVFDYMRKKGIGVHVHYIPVYRHPYYQKLGYRKGLCPNAEAFYERALTLPIYPRMKKGDVSYIVSNLLKAVGRNL